jgi:hypothetical protein
MCPTKKRKRRSTDTKGPVDEENKTKGVAQKREKICNEAAEIVPMVTQWNMQDIEFMRGGNVISNKKPTVL